MRVWLLHGTPCVGLAPPFCTADESSVARDLSGQSLPGRTYGRIWDFSFSGRPDNGYEMVLKLVSGVDVGCVLNHLSSLTCLERGPKSKLKFKF